MRSEYFQNIIDSIRNKKQSPITHVQHEIYGKIYMPYYNPIVPINSKNHEIYNIDGKKMETFFIRDVHFAHNPNYESKYFIWDRYNFGLKTHFYSHEAMLETMGNPDKKYGIFIESETIVPQSYRILDKNKGLNKDFNLILTYSDKILDKYDNARFAPFCSGVWNSDLITPDLHKKKIKDVSILSSNKLMCDLHKYRYDIANMCKNENLADTFGTFDGGPLVNLSDTLNDYRYSICIENDVSSYFFTERLTTALYAQTIPIYLGATEIDKFFNPDGIIKITTKSDIKEVLKQCTKEEYENRLPAILDNYERAKKYLNVWDFVYEKYLQND